MVSNMLDTYCQASGQRVKPMKSTIYFSKGCLEDVRTHIKGHLNVPNEALNDNYLGLPSFVGSSKNDAFKYLTERVWGKS